ncbi:MAG: PEP-CTERM sorting domain-containing protein [Planctomycetaceae bacterium]
MAPVRSRSTDGWPRFGIGPSSAEGWHQFAHHPGWNDGWHQFAGGPDSAPLRAEQPPAVPEPSTVVLTGLGAIAVVWRQSCRRTA